MLEAIAQLGPGDVLDIGLAATLIHLGMRRLRRSQRALVAVGIALAGAGHLVVTGLGLALTPWILQAFFAVLAVALVVIFQDDLRQIFEELAAWALGRRDDYRPRLDAGDILVQSVSGLASRKIGALIVLPGLQTLDRHLTGGEELDGRLSGSLIHSLFDPGSPGHDGAVVIEDRQVLRFGVQLPLSRKLDQLGGGGTRHSAAIGLTERTDALCIVVSEERGSVSTAYGGLLREVPNPVELKTAIDQFYRHRRAIAAPQPRLAGLRRRPLEKLTAVVVAGVLWVVFVAGARPVERVHDLAVEVIHVPAGVEVTKIDPPRVSASLAAPRRQFWLLDEDDLSIAVDAASRTSGTSDLAVLAARLRPAGRFEVRQLHTSTVRVSLARPSESVSGKR